jgi:hypothetical protein
MQLVSRPSVQQRFGELGDGPLRVKVCDQIFIESFEFRIAQGSDAATMIAAIALPRVSGHLQHDDGNDCVATGAVVQDQIASFAGGKDLIHVDLGGTRRCEFGCLWVWRCFRRFPGHGRSR